MAKKAKGIYCLEIGEWSGSLKKPWSVEPILGLLQQSPLGVPYIHRDIATEPELCYYVRKWTQKNHKDYPILYLAFHGSQGCIHLRKENGKPAGFETEALFSLLEGQCHRRVIHFGSCDVLSIHGNTTNKYLKGSKAAAISGYRQDVDWVKSTVFEMLYLSELQENQFTKRGLEAVKRRVKKAAPQLCKSLKFCMKTKK